MAGYDQKSNVVLSESKERVYSIDEGVEEIPLGLYLVKGDQMYAVPPFVVFLRSSQILDQSPDWGNRRSARPINQLICDTSRAIACHPILRNPALIL